MKAARRRSQYTQLVMSVVLVLFASAIACAEESNDLLPREPAAWLNSPPLTSEALQGKGVVLWFYEEDCPKCRGKWPSLYELASRYSGQPVVFIAVNSGNPAAAVQQYAREVKLTWPIIVDPSRQFEKRWLDQEISLQNIHQVELLLPDGRKRHGRWDDLEGSVEVALRGASWKIDPQSIPGPLIPTWQAVEMGNYTVAANLLKKGLVTKNPDVKQAAERVHALVQTEINSKADQAAKARQNGEPWRSLQLYQGISKTFAGYDLPSEVTAAQKELANDPQVKRELEAAKVLDGIQKSLITARSDVARKRLVARLEEFKAKYSGTDAAKQAQEVVSRDAPQ